MSCGPLLPTVKFSRWEVVSMPRWAVPARSIRSSVHLVNTRHEKANERKMAAELTLIFGKLGRILLLKAVVLILCIVCCRTRWRNVWIFCPFKHCVNCRDVVKLHLPQWILAKGTFAVWEPLIVPLFFFFYVGSQIWLKMWHSKDFFLKNPHICRLTQNPDFICILKFAHSLYWSLKR